MRLWDFAGQEITHALHHFFLTEGCIYVLVLDPRSEWHSTPLRATAWRGPIAHEQDPVRNATPEGQRAFLNTEDYYRR